MAKMSDVTEVISVMQNSPTAAYLRECSFHERVMLASLIKCVRREGVEEIKIGDVSYLASSDETIVPDWRYVLAPIPASHIYERPPDARRSQT